MIKKKPSRWQMNTLQRCKRSPPNSNNLPNVYYMKWLRMVSYKSFQTKFLVLKKYLTLMNSNALKTLLEWGSITLSKHLMRCPTMISFPEVSIKSPKRWLTYPQILLYFKLQVRPFKFHKVIHVKSPTSQSMSSLTNWIIL